MMAGPGASLYLGPDRPWSSSHATLGQSRSQGAIRKTSLNDLALARYGSSSGPSGGVRQSFGDLDDSDTLTSLPQIPDSHPGPVGYEAIGPEPARPTARHSFSSVLTHSIEGLRQAAGRKLKPKSRFGRKSTGALQEEVLVERSTEQPRPQQHQSSPGSTWLRGKASTLRRNRRPSELAASAERGSGSSKPSGSPIEMQTNPHSVSPQNFSPAGGEGARAAVAMARGKARDIERTHSPPGGMIPSPRRMSTGSSDNESGILFQLSRQSDETLVPESETSRQDPAHLPTEIFAKVLACLDSESLMQAELVSRRWKEVAKSQHVWKFAFFREFTEPAKLASGIGGDITAGGFGLGFGNGNQPWKRMWQVRKQLDRRWQDGHAAAIYLVGHHDSVYCVQFDEDKIITGSRDWTVRVWDANTLQCTHVLGTPKDVNNTLQPLSARKKQGKQPVVSLVPAGPHDPPVQVNSDARHVGSVLCIDYDKELMVTGSSDCTVIVWSIADGHYTALKQLRAHTMGVLDVRLNDKYIVACSKDTTVSVWDRHTLSLVRVLNGHRGPVNAVQLRDNFVVSASGDGVAKLWNLTNGLCVKEFHPPGDENVGRSRGLACVEFTHDTKTIFAGGNDKKVYQFDTSSGNMVRTFKGHESLVRSLHYDAANGRIVTGSYDHAVWTYDFQTGEPICHFRDWTTSWMLSAKADYRRIVAASQDGKAIVMDFGFQLPGVELLEGIHRRD